MNIASYYSPEYIVQCLLLSIGVLVVLGKAGLIKGVFDPFILMHVQLVFTTIILFFSGLLPIEQLFYMVILYVFMIIIWRKNFSDARSDSEFAYKNWGYCVLLLVIISIPANIFLLLTKGFILLQEDVGAAKVEYYQGVGIVRRINTALAVLLPIHVFYSWSKSGRWNTSNTIGFLYSIYIILSLGSKAGISSLAFAYGSIFYFQKNRHGTATIMAMIVGSMVSTVGMFYLVYGERFMLDLAIRIVAFADGPFYYFREKMKIDVPFDYPFHIFMYAARIIDSLPVSSLGPEINWRYFSLNDELYGPNPQISVESIAIFGDLAFFHYVAFIAIAFLFAKTSKNIYLFALFLTFLRSFPVDSQLAFSNLYNILFVLLIYCISFVLAKYLKIASKWLPTNQCQ